MAPTGASAWGAAGESLIMVSAAEQLAANLNFGALAKADEKQKERILSTLGNSEASPSEIAEVLEIVGKIGVTSEIRNLANSHIDRALAILQELPDTPQRKLLSSWATFLLAREN